VPRSALHEWPTIRPDTRASTITTAQAFTAANRAGAAAVPTEFINFAIGDAQYGVDIMAVREIKGWCDVTHLPEQPDYLRGILNLRGAMIPIIDLRCRFGYGMTEATPLHIVIIVQIGAQQVGLLGDRVLDIVAFDASRIQPVPYIAQTSEVSFLSGLVTVEGAMIALIDLPNLLTLSPVPDCGPAAAAVAA
jgi:purine-binding chemotaxis protein CheW